MENLSNKINAFLNKGNNKKIVKIVDAVILCILTVISIYFIIKVIGADTANNYASTVLKNGLFLLIVGGIDVLLALFTKPLFGFTNFFDNRAAKKAAKAKEKAVTQEIERQAKETLKAAKQARKAAEQRK